MKVKNSLWFAVLLCLLLLSGCKTKQRTPSSPLTANQPAVRIAAQALENQPRFGTMNVSKMNVTAVVASSQFAMRATTKLFTDSLLVVSLQPVLGIEMFRLEFTPSQFVIIDKWNRRYTENSYDFLTYKLGVNFTYEALQAMVSDRLFLLDKQVTANDFALTTIDEMPALEHMSTGVIQRFYLNEAMAVAKTEVVMEQGRMTCTYGNWRTQNGVSFPTEFSLAMTAGNHSFSMACEVTKLEFDKPMSYTSINLSNYEKVAFSKILP